MRRAGRWLADWRNGATLVASVLVALLIYVVVDGARSREEAVRMATQSAKSAEVEAQRGIDSRQASTARINSLQDRITDLINAVNASSAAQSEAQTQAKALEAQVRNLGARPVVTVSQNPPVSTVTTSPPSAPPPTTTTTTTTTTAPPRVQSNATTTTTAPTRIFRLDAVTTTTTTVVNRQSPAK